MRWRRKVSTRAWLVALVLGLVAGAEAHGDAEPGRAHVAPPPSPAPVFEPPAPGSYELPVIQRVGRHQLLDPDGGPVPLLEAGRVAVVSFVFLSCGHACPQATATMQRLDRLLAERGLDAGVGLVTVSFDPQRDRPEQMARQREALQPKGRWRFLTAPDQAGIDEVLRDFGQHVGVWLGPDGEATPQLDHVLKVFLVDAAGGVRNIYSTGYLDPRLMLNDVLTLAGES